MTYTYAYKSSDGVRHEAKIDAPSREAVFETLRGKGIRAIKVVAADGSKANGEVRGVRKRVVVIGALCLVAIAVVASIIAFRAGDAIGTAQSSQKQSPRHQIYGDPVVVEAIERGRLDAYLPRLGDQMLAWFAQPGKLACPKAHSVALNIGRAGYFAARQAANAQATNYVAALEATLDDNLDIVESDPREVRELKQIVNGMRIEFREYLANGNGTVRSYWRRLIERTRQEMQIYERTKRELEGETRPEIFEQRNEGLRNLGLLPIAPPESEE